jgi:predicted AlkP superfamily pyrophosphatase or phosphodiesterase
MIARSPSKLAVFARTTAVGRLAATALLFLTLTSGRLAATAAPVLLISMDGFRWDYCALHPAETPHLRRYAAEGVSASELIPVYPSNTFPNHYAIVTGLYPAHHGIINNEFFDPRLGRFFHYTLPADTAADRWWGGEPIWVTAEKEGLQSASYYWVGSEAAIGGVRPTFAKHFNAADYYRIPFAKRIDDVVGWLRLPPDRRPSVITFYLEETNSAGHKFGPDSPELAAAVKLLDGRLGALMDRLKSESLPVNLIVVSDHGMTAVSPQRVMVLEDYLDPSTVAVDFQSPAMGLRPLKGTALDIVRALARLPHAKAYFTDNRPDGIRVPGGQYLPARFHLTGNPRIPDVWIVPEEGWHMQTRNNAKIPAVHDQKGDHGFDPAFRSMHGILIADGPAFRTGGAVIGPVENIHIYNLMCAVLHLTPAPNDGDDRLVREFLAR